VRIDFHPAKDAINRDRHQLSLGLARAFDWLTGHVVPARTVEGEARWKMTVMHDGTVYAVVFTLRGRTFWVISLRPASRKERRIYEQQ
jgi:uncharacterized DUF497 family protein